MTTNDKVKLVYIYGASFDYESREILYKTARNLNNKGIENIVHAYDLSIKTEKCLIYTINDLKLKSFEKGLIKLNKADEMFGFSTDIVRILRKDEFNNIFDGTIEDYIESLEETEDEVFDDSKIFEDSEEENNEPVSINKKLAIVRGGVERIDIDKKLKEIIDIFDCIEVKVDIEKTHISTSKYCIRVISDDDMFEITNKLYVKGVKCDEVFCFGSVIRRMFSREYINGRKEEPSIYDWIFSNEDIYSIKDKNIRNKAIKYLHDEGMRSRDIADKFNLTDVSINNIVKKMKKEK